MKNEYYIMKFCKAKTTYIAKQRNYNVLQHDEKEKHKYVAKVEMPKYTRYFYSNEEYQSYLENQKSETIFDKLGSFFDNVIGKSLSSVADKFKKGFSFAQKTVSDVFSKTISSVDNIAKKVRKIVFGSDNDSKIENSKETKYVAKVEMPNYTRYFYSQEEYDKYLKRVEYQKNEPDFMKDVPEIDYSKEEDLTTDLIDINDRRFKRSWANGDYKYTTNCQLCTITYELQQRGYKVKAAAMDLYDWDFYKMASEKGLSYVFENPYYAQYDGSINKPVDLEGFIKRNNPLDSRGSLMVSWIGGGGHAVAYEVDKRGNVKILDGQTGKEYSSSEEISKFASRVDPKDICQLVRTDKLKLKEDILKYVDY